MQGQAADLNLLQEKIATSTDASQMENELQLLLLQNEREAHDAEETFEVIKSVKEKMINLERDIQTVSLLSFAIFCPSISMLVVRFRRTRTLRN